MSEDGGMASMSVWQANPSRILNEIPRIPAHYSYNQRRHLVRIYIYNAGVRSTDPIGCGIRSATGRAIVFVSRFKTIYTVNHKKGVIITLENLDGF